jgi:SdrD B-like domain
VYVKDDMACIKPITVSSIARLGDRVWHDADKNGIQNAGEVGISGSTVSLYTCGGTLVSSTMTNINGNYLFDQLNP